MLSFPLMLDGSALTLAVITKAVRYGFTTARCLGTKTVPSRASLHFDGVIVERNVSFEAAFPLPSPLYN